MNQLLQSRVRAGQGPHSAQFDSAQFDIGLRTYLLRVYNYMASGLALTGAVAYAAAASGLYAEIAHTPMIWLVLFAPLGLVFALSAGIEWMGSGTAKALFWAYAALTGLSLAGIFLVFTGVSIARVFFIAGATFGAMSRYGQTTQTDLSKFGSFLTMGLVGLIIASMVNIFVASSALQFALSVVGVIVFVGLTAWDTQRIKAMYAEQDDEAVAGKKAIMGALTLYLDFINLFLMLLQIMGQRRE
mgnify:CR=1 FL=1